MTPRSIAELEYEGGGSEMLLRVRGARVAFADYARLRADFPFLPRRSAAIDEWLLSRCAVVSAVQSRPNPINEAVPLAGGMVEAFRPPLYGRAAVVAANDSGDGGLLDLKGIGVAAGQTPNDHRNGLQWMWASFAEMQHHWYVDAVFQHAGAPFRAVPHYAVIDFGFDARSGKAAGVLVRQAHRRFDRGWEMPLLGSVDARLRLEIELLLRRYGMSSCGPGTGFTVGRCGGRIFAGNPPDPSFSEELLEEIGRLIDIPEGTLRFDGLNVQLAGDEASPMLIDFQSFQFHSRFSRPLANMVRDRPISFGEAVWPTDTRFVQPALPCRSHEKRLETAGDEKAHALREGRISRGEIARWLRTSVQRRVRRFGAVGREGD